MTEQGVHLELSVVLSPTLLEGRAEQNRMRLLVWKGLVLQETWAPEVLLSGLRVGRPRFQNGRGSALVLFSFIRVGLRELLLKAGYTLLHERYSGAVTTRTPLQHRLTLQCQGNENAGKVHRCRAVPRLIHF